MEKELNAHQMLIDGKRVQPSRVVEANLALVRGITQSAAQSILGKFHDLSNLPTSVRTAHYEIRLRAEHLATAMEKFYREVGKYNAYGTLRPKPAEPVTASEIVAAEADPAIPKDSPRCNCKNSTLAACPIHPGPPYGISKDTPVATTPNIPPAQATRKHHGKKPDIILNPDSD